MQSPSPIDQAATTHTYLFVAYIGVLVIAAGLTVLVWRAGNSIQI